MLHGCLNQSLRILLSISEKQILMLYLYLYYLFCESKSQRSIPLPSIPKNEISIFYAFIMHCGGASHLLHKRLSQPLRFLLSISTE